ncbi:MAG: protein containing Coagulation factor 5/8 type [Clostridia bacterium]|nr:protein containing Coagulation factor 5/8 type [Clostridia bacterium]
MHTPMTWPEGQIFPTFDTPVPNMDAFSTENTPGEWLVALLALQGIVNREQPRIFMYDNTAGEGPDTWANTYGFTYVLRDKLDIFKKYADEVSGFVLYSTEKSEHYVNLAGSVASPIDGIPVTRAVMDALIAAGIDLPLLCDLTALPYTTATEIYTYLYEAFWQKNTHRLILSQRPHMAAYIRDLAAATGAAIVFLNCRDSKTEQAVYRRFLNDMEPGAAIATGWYTEERSGITTATSAGLSTVPSDFFANATVYAQRIPIRIREIPPVPALENKIYISIFVSDGDNIQYVEHYMRQYWDRNAASRGKVAVNWTISPSCADTAPGMMNYYYDNSTEKDCFVSGPSGMGYAMPVNTLWEDIPSGNYVEDLEKFSKYAALSNRYFERTGLKVVTIWDNLTEEQREIYTENAPSLYGLTVQLFTDDRESVTSVHNGKVCKQLTPCYTTTREHLSHVLFREAERFNGNAPLFIGAQMSVWGRISLNDLYEMEQELKQKYDGKVEFVRADHFFKLYNAHLNEKK